MSGLTVWTFAVSGVATVSFYRQVESDYRPRFDGKYQYTKDLVLGATTAAQSYIDLGAFEVGPLSMKCQFTTEALRQTFQGLLGYTGTLSNTKGLSYTAMLVQADRVNTATEWLADATWEQR